MQTPSATAGRTNQRRRARKDLLEATARLLKQGRKPSLQDVAEEALVSRATAYRYFPSVEALLAEASVDVAVPDPQSLFGPAADDDPVVRMMRVDDVLSTAVVEHEAPLRIMLAHSLEQNAGGGSRTPRRQNRRTPLIEAALAPVKQQIPPDTYKALVSALALVVGTESMIVSKDVLQLTKADARKTRRWAIAAIIRAALAGTGDSNTQARTMSR